jgi:hypothetical protein
MIWTNQSVLSLGSHSASTSTLGVRRRCDLGSTPNLNHPLPTQGHPKLNHFMIPTTATAFIGVSVPSVFSVVNPILIEPDGASNGRQPARPVSMRAPASAGSRR